MIKIGGYSTRTVKVQTKNTLTFESAKSIEDSIIWLLFEAKDSSKTFEQYCNDIAELVFNAFDKSLLWRKLLNDAKLTDDDVKTKETP